MTERTATRRGFFLKAGAAISAPATFVSAARATTHSTSALEARIAELEDVNALRGLTAEFVRLVNAGADISSVLETTAARIVMRDFDTEAVMRFSGDRRTAVLTLACEAGFDRPIDAPGSALVDMARLQGEGSVRRTRAQLLRLSCVRERSGWTIAHARLEDAA